MKLNQLLPRLESKPLLGFLIQDVTNRGLGNPNLAGDIGLAHAACQDVGEEFGPVHGPDISTLIAEINSTLLEKTNKVPPMSTSTRIRQLRDQRGLSQLSLALKAGVTQGTISQLENNPSQGSKYLPAIARALDVSVDWLETGKGPMERPPKAPIDPSETDQFIAIRKVAFRISAGIAGFAVDYIDSGDGGPLFFQRSWFEARGFDPDKLYALKVRGASMEPTLSDGDHVVINTADVDPTDGDVFACNYEGEFVIKRIIRDSGDWWLSSDNMDSRRFPRKRCDEHTFIIGRVVHRQSERI